MINEIKATKSATKSTAINSTRKLGFYRIFSYLNSGHSLEFVYKPRFSSFKRGLLFSH